MRVSGVFAMGGVRGNSRDGYPYYPDYGRWTYYYYSDHGYDYIDRSGYGYTRGRGLFTPQA